MEVRRQRRVPGASKSHWRRLVDLLYTGPECEKNMDLKRNYGLRRPVKGTVSVFGSSYLSRACTRWKTLSWTHKTEKDECDRLLAVHQALPTAREGTSLWYGEARAPGAQNNFKKEEATEAGKVSVLLCRNLLFHCGIMKTPPAQFQRTQISHDLHKRWRWAHKSFILPLAMYPPPGNTLLSPEARNVPVKKFTIVVLLQSHENTTCTILRNRNFRQWTSRESQGNVQTPGFANLD